jgi:hypothetical protein
VLSVPLHGHRYFQLPDLQQRDVKHGEEFYRPDAQQDLLRRMAMDLD